MGDGMRAMAKRLERVKGIEPSSSAWKGEENPAASTHILTNRPFLAL
jgi:hypothetical protein